MAYNRTLKVREASWRKTFISHCRLGCGAAQRQERRASPIAVHRNPRRCTRGRAPRFNARSYARTGDRAWGSASAARHCERRAVHWILIGSPFAPHPHLCQYVPAFTVARLGLMAWIRPVPAFFRAQSAPPVTIQARLSLMIKACVLRGGGE